jgi:Uma2 family endonuclease
MSSAQRLLRLGNLPSHRIVAEPAPGTATVDDLVAAGKPVCELVDGTLVRSAVGFTEAVLNAFLAMKLMTVVRETGLGILTNTLAPCELAPGLVRTANLAFTPWSRMPGRRMSKEPITRSVPTLVCWMVYPDNTDAEMARKRDEYFRAGVRLLWEIDPRTRTVREYTAPHQARDLTAADTLDGRDVLPGFSLTLAELFAELDRHG